MLKYIAAFLVLSGAALAIDPALQAQLDAANQQGAQTATSIINMGIQIKADKTQIEDLQRQLAAAIVLRDDYQKQRDLLQQHTGDPVAYCNTIMASPPKP